MSQEDKSNQAQVNLDFIKQEVARQENAYWVRRAAFIKQMMELEPEDNLLDLLREQNLEILVTAETICRWLVRLDEVLATDDLAAIAQMLEALQAQLTGLLVSTAKTLDDSLEVAEVGAYADLIGQLQFWHNLLKPFV
jgi:hypothetical protein